MSIVAFSYEKLLLSNAITSSQLETQLATADNLASFRKMLTIRSSMIAIAENITALNLILGSALAKGALLASNLAFSFIAESPLAIKNICTSTDILLALFSNSDPSLYMTIKNNPVGFSALKAQANASGSKFKRYVFTASGTWTPPSNIQLACYFAVGSGGNGSVTTGGGYKGGGGGETVCLQQTSSFPTIAQTVTVAVGSNTSVGSIITATKGATGNSGGAGGGTTSGDNIQTLKDLYTADDVYNEPWTFGTYNIVGGSGGAYSTTQPEYGTSGGWLYSFGGIPGGGAKGAGAGVGIGAGGGGGLSVSANIANGYSASSVSWGSGGGQANHNGSAGSGNAGLVIISCVVS